MTDRLRDLKISLIGGAGFIGSNLALHLARAGARVEVVDSLGVNNLAALTATDPETPQRELYLQILRNRLERLEAAQISLHLIDARDRSALTDHLARTAPMVIVHLAAVADARRAHQDPRGAFDHGLVTLANALEIARQGTTQFVFLSSSMVYGHFCMPAVDEESPLSPVDVYGNLKLAGENMIHGYQQAFGLETTIIRPSALYGPGCVSRRVGQLFIENALRNATLRVFGDGSEGLDFTHIDDLVEGVALAINNPLAYNQTFNMTFGQARSIQDLVTIVRRHFPQAAVEYVPRDDLMPIRGTLSIDKARRLLGYEPRHSLDAGISQYIDWYRQLTAHV